jgi:hypothetical protein
LHLLIGSGPRSFRRAVKNVTKSVAKQAEKMMKRIIRTNKMATTKGGHINSPMTFKILAARAALSSKFRYTGSFPQSPLYRNHQIHNSIKTVDMKNGDFFVGLTQSAKQKAAFDRRGGSKPLVYLAKIARRNERGFKMTVTEEHWKFFAFLAKASRKLGLEPSGFPKIGSTMTMPPRSFRLPVQRAFQQTGFGEGQAFEKAAERAFFQAIMLNPFFGRHLKVLTA